MNNLLPIFIKLECQSCLVVGGGKIAYQKIQQLLESKASVTVIAQEIHKSNKLPGCLKRVKIGEVFAVCSLGNE